MELEESLASTELGTGVFDLSSKLEPIHDLVNQLLNEKLSLTEKTRLINEQNRQLDLQIDQMRKNFDKERTLKDAAIRRLLKQICQADGVVVGQLSTKGALLYERRVRKLLQQMTTDEFQKQKRLQAVADYFVEQLHEKDLEIGRMEDEIGQLRLQLNIELRHLEQLRLGIPFD